MDDGGNDDVGAMYSARSVVSDCKWGMWETVVCRFSLVRHKL